jgi:putative ABC transport system substrate-binding protein
LSAARRSRGRSWRRAQQGERMRRIGVLLSGAADDRNVKVWLAAFLQGLLELGWGEGRNLRIEYRLGALGDAERTRKYAAELVALAPDVIFASGTAQVGPLLQATRTVPIIFAIVADPVGAGFVDSLARPGGNVTGTSPMTSEVVGTRWSCSRRPSPPSLAWPSSGIRTTDRARARAFSRLFEP